MANQYNLPPFLHEFDQFLSSCKKMNSDLAKTTSRISELEIELAKEKAERKNLQNLSHRKIQELSAHNETLKQELQKNLRAQQDEATQLRTLLMTTQNEHKSVLKIMQEELERSQASIQSEKHAKTELQREYERLNTEHNTLATNYSKLQDVLKNLKEQLNSSKKEFTTTQEGLKRTQSDYARIIESSGRAEEIYKKREVELLRKLEEAQSLASSETESKNWINQMLMKAQNDYEKLFKLFLKEQEKAKNLEANVANAARASTQQKASKNQEVENQEILRLQEELIRTKKAQQALDQARKSAQSLANQLKLDLDSARAQIEKLRTVEPMKVLLLKKEFEIKEISHQIAQLPAHHSDRRILTASLNEAIQQKSKFEQLLHAATLEQVPATTLNAGAPAFKA